MLYICWVSQSLLLLQIVFILHGFNAQNPWPCHSQPIFGHSCSFESEISTCSSWHSLRTLLPLLPSVVALASLSLPWLASRLVYGYWPQPRQCRRPPWSLGLQFLQQRHWWKSAKALISKDTQYIFSSHKSVVFLNKILWFFMDKSQAMCHDEKSLTEWLLMVP